MSVINQMLRDLDARTAQPALGAAPPPPRDGAGTGRGVRKLALAGLLLAAGAVVWLGLQARSSQTEPLENTLSAPKRIGLIGDAVSPSPAPQPVVAADSTVSPGQAAPGPEAAPLPTLAASAGATPPSAATATARVASGAAPLAVPSGRATAPPSPGATSGDAPLSAGTTPNYATLELGSKLSRSLSLPDPATPRPTPAPANAPEASVVKKLSDLSPEAEAAQFSDEAQALRRAGRLEAAAGKYRLALERQPGLRSARLQLARLLQDSGQPDAAFAVLKTGYDTQRDGALAIAAGRLLADQGQSEEAVRWLERGRDQMRAADQALLGALQAQGGRYDEAARAYQRALAVEPNQGGWLLGLGLALEVLGRRDDAQLAFRQALERGDFKPEVVRYLRQKINAGT